MVRKLKHHEQKLLKKVDFLDWKQDNGHRDAEVMRKYHIQKREDYHKYNKICGDIRKLAHKLSLLQATDPVRIKHEQLLLEKLYSMGILPTKSKISDLENKVTVSAMCRRRIGVVMCRLKMAENLKDAITFVEQGHVRVGPNIVTDPAYLVTRSMEDYLTWVDTSKIKQNLLKFRNQIDDFEFA
ncbi:CYFA0S01e05578g1_1 [Cyberlindnera fabianii]|uniref:U3 small nucleolar ribonucleoprotein protein IMP3 n=1 Tax=Cyberlindnera fabianii TaxID=36022 RepID=A0A061AIH7_CYBFA|nr:U3 small nucleolar ribonucleoprotein IMP3 [Cyberlindnera fabianii]CDR36922.1 CYFA0S01e05578g1_1 [Cyberlindnera fabianii]